MVDECRDAVVVLPGVMGSELVETSTGRVLWGISDARWYADAWTTGDSLAALHVTDDEREGRTGRVTATRPLRFPAFAPMLRGFEPYAKLLTGARQAAAHPDAVLPFPYDWRLSVSHAAARLAEAAEDHLRAWRAHPRGSREARLILIGHSMGGLVAHAFMADLGGARDVRTLITLGTPFSGSVLAAGLLGSGRGGPLPLPRRRLRALARTLPGLHELLPGYRCVREPDGAFRRFTASDAAALGGDRELAQQALDRQDRLRMNPLPQLRPVVGVGQRTGQSLTLSGGEAELHEYVPDRMGITDRRGDGTVYRDAAAPAGERPFYVPQSHGALVRSEEALAHVGAMLTETLLGAPLGAAELGLYVPDVVSVGQPLPIEVDVADDPGAAVCQVFDAATNLETERPRLVVRDGRLRAEAWPTRPGLYRVEATSGGFSAVRQYVLVVAHG